MSCCLNYLAVEHWVKEPEFLLVVSVELEVVDLVVRATPLEGHVVNDKDRAGEGHLVVVAVVGLEVDREERRVPGRRRAVSLWSISSLIIDHQFVVEIILDHRSSTYQSLAMNTQLSSP